jgi:hypothetical protein
MKRRGVPVFVSIVLGLAATARAQELEPRAFSANPTGVTFVNVTYGRTDGDVVFDASLPFRDVEATVNAGALACARTFPFLGRTASAALALPYLWGSMEGNVGETFTRITRSGLADVRARLAMNLVGGEALAPPAFAARRPRTTLGAALSLSAPSGQYDPAKLINLGTNRWAFKPQLGLAHPRGPWVFELSTAAWLFTANDDFFGGHRRTQRPIGTLEGHVSRTFKPGLWAAADANLYAGGTSALDGVEGDDRKENTRVGLTLSVPVARRHSIRAAWASGMTTRSGGDFDAVTLSWQYFWLD